MVRARAKPRNRTSGRFVGKQVVTGWRTTRLIAVVCIFAGSAIWLTKRHFASRPVIDQHGRPVPDVLVSEIGGFADPKFSGLLQDYLANLEFYRTLPTVQVTGHSVGSFSGVLRPSLLARLKSDPVSAKALSGFPEDVQSQLVDHIALMLARCAGLPSVEYLERLQPSHQPHLPRNIDLLNYVCNEFMNGRWVPLNELNEEAVVKLFEEAYELSTSYRGGAGRLVAWVQDSRGMMCAVGLLSGSLRNADLLIPRMTDAEANHYLGRLSQSAVVFETGQSEAARQIHPSTGVLHFQMVVIVLTAAGDMYPLHLKSWYDSNGKRWWLSEANRNSSPRMATMPHLVL